MYRTMIRAQPIAQLQHVEFLMVMTAGVLASAVRLSLLSMNCWMVKPGITRV